MRGKGRFTKFEVKDDNTILVWFSFKHRWGNVNMHNVLKFIEENWLGYIDATIINNGKRIDLTIHYGKVDDREFPLGLDLEEQGKALTNVFKNSNDLY